MITEWNSGQQRSMFHANFNSDVRVNLRKKTNIKSRDPKMKSEEMRETNNQRIKLQVNDHQMVVSMAGIKHTLNA